MVSDVVVDARATRDPPAQDGTEVVCWWTIERERENHTCILYMTHFAHNFSQHTPHAITPGQYQYNHSPAGVGCCEVVSDDVFSFSLPDSAQVRESKCTCDERVNFILSTHPHDNIHNTSDYTHQLWWAVVRWSQSLLAYHSPSLELQKLKERGREEWQRDGGREGGGRNGKEMVGDRGEGGTAERWWERGGREEQQRDGGREGGGRETNRRKTDANGINIRKEGTCIYI